MFQNISFLVESAPGSKHLELKAALIRRLHYYDFTLLQQGNGPPRSIPSRSTTPRFLMIRDICGGGAGINQSRPSKWRREEDGVSEEGICRRLNGFLVLSLNDRTILFLVSLSRKRHSLLYDACLRKNVRKNVCFFVLGRKIPSSAVVVVVVAVVVTLHLGGNFMAIFSRKGALFSFAPFPSHYLRLS